MITITMHCNASLGQGQAKNEDVDVEVPDDFFEWEEKAQFKYLEDDFEDWLSSNVESGFDFSIQ